MPPLIRALRPKQWTKNGLLFAAILFAEQYTDPAAVVSVLIGTALFCGLSSAGYLLNDLKDVEADRAHPKKKHRPIASGEISERAAKTVAVLLVVGGLGGAFQLNPGFGWTALAYLCVTVSYTLLFKHVVILDVMLIASGFLLRAVAGAEAIPVESSSWFLCCTGFGALFLGLSKRLAEIRILKAGAGDHRKILEEYSEALLGQLIAIVVACTLISYALYTFTAGHPQELMLSIPFVIYGMFRYLFIVAQKGEGGEPENTLLRDRPLQLAIVLFAVVVLLALRFGTLV